MNTERQIAAAVTTPIAFAVDTIFSPWVLLVRPSSLYMLTRGAANTVTGPTCPDLIEQSNAVNESKTKEINQQSQTEAPKAAEPTSSQSGK